MRQWYGTTGVLMGVAADAVFTKRDIDGFVAELDHGGGGGAVAEAGNTAFSMLAALVSVPVRMVALALAGALSPIGLAGALGALAMAALLVVIGYRAGFDLWSMVAIAAGIFVVVFLIAMAFAASGERVRTTNDPFRVACDLDSLTLNGQTWSLAAVTDAFGTEGAFYVEAEGELHEVHNAFLTQEDADAISSEILKFIAHDRARRQGGAVPEELAALLERKGG